MIRKLHQRQPVEVTMFVALMLVVQMLLSGLSIGARAATLEAGGFGVICSVDGGKIGDAGSSGTTPAHSVDCCTFGCSMVGGAVPTGPDHACAIANPIRIGRVIIPVVETVVAHLDLSPQNPRGPPELS